MNTQVPTFHAESQQAPLTPAKAGVQFDRTRSIGNFLDARFRGHERRVWLLPHNAGNSVKDDRLDKTKVECPNLKMAFYVYILANKRNGTLYTGMTDDLVRRVWQHRMNILPGFTEKYGVRHLVWYEGHESRESAFTRERQLKKWKRAWKLQLVESINPDWRDLWEEIAN